MKLSFAGVVFAAVLLTITPGSVAHHSFAAQYDRTNPVTLTGTFLTQTGIIAGTPVYMAPEHLRGEDASPDWDLWALGMVAFEMLTGRVPQGAPGAFDLGPLPPPLRPVFSRALSPNPLDRPASAAELLSEIERALTAHDRRA